jgi:hypothetical protein
MSFCTNCGSRLGVSDKFCSGCSEKVTANFDQVAENESSATEYKEIKRDFWWILFMFFLVYVLYEQVRIKTGDFDVEGSILRFSELIIVGVLLWYAIFVKAIKNGSTALLTFLYICLVLHAAIFYSFFVIEEDDFFSTEYWTTKTYVAPLCDFLIIIWIGRVRSNFKNM